jgi:hypothetical protein
MRRGLSPQRATRHFSIPLASLLSVFFRSKNLTHLFVLTQTSNAELTPNGLLTLYAITYAASKLLAIGAFLRVQLL